MVGDPRIRFYAGQVLHDQQGKALVLTGTDGEFLEWNNAAERLLGLTGEELARRSTNDPDWKAVRLDGSEWPAESLPAVVCLRT